MLERAGKHTMGAEKPQRGDNMDRKIEMDILIERDHNIGWNYLTLPLKKKNLKRKTK